MSQRDPHTDRELASLEAMLRGAGRPYEKPTPDAAYWASFRVRVMARAEKKRGFAAVSEWISEHLLGSGLIGAGVAAAIFAATFGLPFEPSTAPVAQHPTAQAPPAAAQIAEQPASEQPSKREDVVTSISKPMASSTATRHVSKAPITKQTVSDDSPMLASVEVSPVLAAGTESEYPVSLAELSDDELELVYDGLRTMDATE